MSTFRETTNRARLGILASLLILTIGVCFYSLSLRPGEEKANKPMVRNYFLASESAWNNLIKNHCERIKGSNAYDSMLEEEYQIYSVLLDRYRTNDLIESMPLMMNKAVSGICDEPAQFFLREGFVQSKNIQTVSSVEEISDYQEYHSSVGLLTFSRVAFNEGHSEAYASLHYSCGSLCGFSEFIILRSADNQWFIDRETDFDVVY